MDIIEWHNMKSNNKSKSFKPIKLPHFPIYSTINSKKLTCITYLDNTIPNFHNLSMNLNLCNLKSRKRQTPLYVWSETNILLKIVLSRMLKNMNFSIDETPNFPRSWDKNNVI